MGAALAATTVSGQNTNEDDIIVGSGGDGALPTGIADGDLLITALSFASGDFAWPEASITEPSGWTQSGYELYGSDTHGGQISYHQLVAAPAASYTWATTPGNLDQVTYIMAAVDGHQGVPVGYAEANGNGTTWTPPALATVTSDGYLVFAAGSVDSGALFGAAPGTYTQQAEEQYTSQTTGFMMTDHLDPITTTTPGTITFDASASEPWVAFTFAVRDAASGVGATLGLVSETDAVLALGKAKDKAIGLVSETDAVLALTAAKAAALGLILETDAVLTLSSAKAKALGLVLETDTVLAVSSGLSVALGLVSETDAVLAIAGSAKAKALGLVAETDAVQAVTGAKDKAIGLVSETDAVLALTALRSAALGIVSETDSVLAPSSAKTKALGLVSETDSVLALLTGIVQAVGLVTETDTVLALSAAKAKALGIVTETDIVLSVTLVPVVPPDAVTGTRPSNERVGYRGEIRVARFCSQPELHFGGGLVIEVQGTPGPDNRGDGLLLIDPDDFLLVLD